MIYLIKVKVLTYTFYKEHYDLYTEIHGSIAVSSCQIELSQRDISLLSSISIIFYKSTFSHTSRHHLDFKILDENNNEVIPRTFYLQLLNKQ